MGKLRRPELQPGPLDDLVRELHALHARAGWPSTRELARGQDFSYTSVHDLFTKTVSEPPRLPVLHKVVECLASMAPRTNLEETLDRFDALWRAADEKPFGDPSPEREREITQVQADVQMQLERDRAEAQLRAGTRANEALVAKQEEIAERAIEVWAKIAQQRTDAEFAVWDASHEGGDPTEPDGVSRPPLPSSGQQRSMTKELFFLADDAPPLHDAAAELRRAGFYVRDQPRDIEGTWHLMAYSATSELSRKDLATLDDIAERCGVDFDGWGTYVGPPELDDGPGKPKITIKPSSEPLFEINGEVLTTPGAVQRMHELGVGRAELVRRHTHGDWGDVSPEEILENERAVRSGRGGIFSGYGQGDERLLVVTEADRSVTTISTPEEL